MRNKIAAFYKFVRLNNIIDRQPVLLSYCQTQGIKGTILLAPEGINGTIAGTPEAIASVLSYLCSDPLLVDLEYKESHVDTLPFVRIKVRLKREIVTIGLPEIDPKKQVGTYINPQDWNGILQNPEVTVIDTRNNYEVGIGSFHRAINPHINSFREFPEYVGQNLDPEYHKKVALFCTGGIRCEKATSFLLGKGFPQVYHLKGGILRYLEEIPSIESLWSGECFVFDKRMAVSYGLEPCDHEMDPNCEVKAFYPQRFDSDTP